MARERNMRRIFLVFALICLLLVVYLFTEVQRLEQRLEALTAESRAVEQSPQPVRKQLRRRRVVMWAALGACILLIASAAATGGRRRHAQDVR